MNRYDDWRRNERVRELAGKRMTHGSSASACAIARPMCQMPSLALTSRVYSRRPTGRRVKALVWVC